MGYMITVLLGLAIHGLVVLPLLMITVRSSIGQHPRMYLE